MRDIEYFENLPQRQCMKAHLQDRWGSYKCDKVDGRPVYKIVDDVCEKFVGKSTDDAFSYYCKKVPKRFQYEFWKEIRREKRWWNGTWYDSIDGVIHRADAIKRNPVYFQSFDYKMASRHFNKNGIELFNSIGWYNPKKIAYTKYVVISGFRLPFNSYKSRSYKKTSAEDRDRYHKMLRGKKKHLKELEYNFKHEKEEEI